MKIEVSNGELVDRVSILSIKLKKFQSEAKLASVKKEHDLLYQEMLRIGISDKSDVYQKLLQINTRLWEIEDSIRRKESQLEFDDDFIQLARQVYFKNDERSNIKRQINIETKSDLIEEKEYTAYR